MSDHSDIWYEMNKDKIEKEKIAKKFRERLVQELSPNDMVRIIFDQYISKLDDYEITIIGEKYLNPLSDALQKQIPKQFIYPSDDKEPYKCPACNNDLGFTDDYFGDLEITHYCKNCGQKLCK